MTDPERRILLTPAEVARVREDMRFAVEELEAHRRWYGRCPACSEWLPQHAPACEVGRGIACVKNALSLLDAAAARPRPRVVCLCGSTRFTDAYIAAYASESDAGRIVLTVSRLTPVRDVAPDVKAKRDDLHLRKIDLADEVLVLDVGGYIGESTRNEIAHATRTGKPIRYLSQEAGIDAAAARGETAPATTHRETCKSAVCRSDVDVDDGDYFASGAPAAPPVRVSDERVAEILARAEKATPGPWITFSNRLYAKPSIDERHNLMRSGDERDPCWIEEDDDANFLAAAREDVPDLALDLQAARRALAEARAELVTAALRARADEIERGGIDA
jgi:hypothetical protein